MKAKTSTRIQSLTTSIQKPGVLEVCTTDQLWIAFIFSAVLYCIF